MKKFIKFGILPVLAVIMMAAFSACSDDEDEPNDGRADYYVTCTKVYSAYFTPQQCTAAQNELNESMGNDVVLKNVKKDYAIKSFDISIKELANRLSNSYKGIPLEVTFALKSKNGVTVKSSTLVISEDGKVVIR